MKDYLRLEKIRYRYKPYLLIARIALDICLIILNHKYVFPLIVLCGFLPVNLKYVTEEEYIIPMSDTDIKKRRMMYVKITWLRFALLGIVNLVKTLIFDSQNQYDYLINRPVIIIPALILTLILLYRALIGETFFVKGRSFFPEPVFRFIFCVWIPFGILTYYTIENKSIEEDLMTIPSIVHIIVMIFGMLLVSYSIILLNVGWKIRDYDSSNKRIRYFEYK